MTESASQGPGAELKATREGMEVSTREVADALNLPTHVIEALEADDHDRLPPTVFTRGYLRSYARLLELDSDRLLASYPEVTGEVDLVTGETTVVTPSLSVSKETIGIAVAVAVTLVVIGLLVWLLTGRDDEADQTDNPAEAVSTSSGRTELERPALDPQSGAVLESDAEVGIDDQPLAGESIPEAEQETGTRAATQAATEAPARTPAAAGPPGVDQTRTVTQPIRSFAATAPAAGIPAQSAGRRERRITEFGDDVITMVFAEDCWVEVKTMDEVNLYSDLNRAGQTLILTGRAPFHLRLGYAPGVTLSFNGQTLPLGRHSRNNVANLVVGE